MLLNPDGWRLEVVELTRRLVVAHLRRRLIQVTDRWRLVNTSLRRRLVVDFRSLRNDTLLRNIELRGHVARVRKRRLRDVEVRHSPFPCQKAEARRINLAPKVAAHSTDHDKLRLGMIRVSQGSVYARLSRLMYPCQTPHGRHSSSFRGLFRSCCISCTQSPLTEHFLRL